MMTKVEVLAERERLIDELADRQLEVELVQTKLRALRVKCKHPDRVMTSHMGESCFHCYDCGLCP